MINYARKFESTRPGQHTVDLSPGDFILTHQNGIIYSLIRFGQRLRFRGADRSFAFWNHAALVVHSMGDIIEAHPRGVRKANLYKEYNDKEYTVVKQTDITDRDREQMIKFAESCVGQQYGFLTILSLGLWCIFGGKFNFSLDGTEICSGLVARALERNGEIFSRDPCREMPADLARHFQVKLPKLVLSTYTFS